MCRSRYASSRFTAILRVLSVLTTFPPTLLAWKCRPGDPPIVCSGSTCLGNVREYESCNVLCTDNGRWPFPCQSVIFYDSKVECESSASCSFAEFHRSEVQCVGYSVDGFNACHGARFYDSKVTCYRGYRDDAACLGAFFAPCSCCYQGSVADCPIFVDRCNLGAAPFFCAKEDLGVTCKARGNPVCADVQQPTTPPTRAPTRDPTIPPTRTPTRPPTGKPTRSPTNRPTPEPTRAPATKPPTRAPTEQPSHKPTPSPTGTPTPAPTKEPTRTPSRGPTKQPTHDPRNNPSLPPMPEPTRDPTPPPSPGPTTVLPSFVPSLRTSADIISSPAPVSTPGLRPESPLAKEQTHSSKRFIIPMVVALAALFLIVLWLVLRRRSKKLILRRRSKTLVFLSFTGRDDPARKFTDHLAEELGRRKISYFLDQEHLRAGDDFPEVIKAKVRACSVFVCIISSQYFSRYFCMLELDVALNNEHCTIIPVHYEYQLPRADEFDEPEFRRRIKDSKWRVNNDELDRWCGNIDRLRTRQRVTNLVTGRREESALVKETASAVEDALRRNDAVA